MAKGIDIQITNAQLNITNRLRRFRMKRTQPEMKIVSETPSFKVNWDTVRSQSGLETPRYFMNSNRQKAYEKTMNAIGRIVAEGDMMTRIDNSSPDDMVSAIAVQNMRSAIPEFNIVTMPQDLAEITWDKGVFEINWTKGSLDVVWDEEYMPEYSVTPYSVEVSIRELSRIKVNDTGNRKLEGRKVDRKI